MAKYAVNIADLTKAPLVGHWLVGPVIPSKRIVQAEKDRLDGAAVVLECSAERAEAIVRLIQTKYRRHQLRCYVSKTGRGWKRV
jgi:hypothetical protein